MFETTKFDKNNEILLCNQKDKHTNMLMTIYVKKLLAGEEITLTSDTDEIAALLIEGDVDFIFENRREHAARESAFEQKPYAVHVCKNKSFKIVANAESEIIVQQTDNDAEFETEFYNPDNVLYQEFGSDQWDGSAHRIVSTMFDIDNAPKSKMVLGEVYNKQGCWSSYPPHHHPQPEVYYFRFDKPQGFGACYNGDEIYKSVDRSFCTITDGQIHSQVVAPGYTKYYVWMIRHLDNNPWYKTTRIVADEHSWMSM
jgi:5-deoxy-glucuronate isomerase